LSYSAVQPLELHYSTIANFFCSSWFLQVQIYGVLDFLAKFSLHITYVILNVNTLTSKIAMGIYKLTHFTLYECGTKPESWRTLNQKQTNYHNVVKQKNYRSPLLRIICSCFLYLHCEKVNINHLLLHKIQLISSHLYV